MARITYIEFNGTEHTVDIADGLSVMEGAVTHMIPGIEGDCGGLCACATCHVYIHDDWLASCGEKEELEINILDFAYDVQDNSRLACQIKVTDDLEGMVVQMPERQY
jgi:ferredoxin, 2Fe-2S